MAKAAAVARSAVMQLSAAITHDEANGLFLNGPRRREAPRRRSLIHGNGAARV